MRVSRVSVAVFGVLLGALAFGFSFFDGILWLAFKIAGVTFGSLLGVFLLGLVTRRQVADGANVAAMVVMAVVNLALLVLIETGALPLAWSWLVIIGTAGTILLVAVLAPRALRPGDGGHAGHLSASGRCTPRAGSAGSRRR